jgi:peptidoglycan/LPS O-acetylase OafA/YrhL
LLPCLLGAVASLSKVTLPYPDCDVSNLVEGPDSLRQSSRTTAFRPDIEGLRGIAVLIVVTFHCGIPGSSGGFVGVDVFFVLSGYLITGLLVSEIQGSSRLSLLHFYGRRVRRLLPASALTLVVTLFIGAVVLAPTELVFAGRAARATALYVSNVFFAANAADYFAPNVQSNPMLHTWSLAVEEQFYLLWPLLIMLGLQVMRSRRVLVTVLSVLTVTSLAVCVWFTAHSGTFAFYQLPARAWEFGGGGLAVLLAAGKLRISPRGWFALGWLGVLAILGSASFISSSSNFPGAIALVPVLGTVLALVAGAALPGGGVGALLDSAPLQFLGKLSYSWYLWHWPFLVLAKALLPNISMAGKTGVALVALLVAAVTHHFVENPIRFHPHLVSRPARTMCLAVSITLCSLAAAILCMKYAAHLSNTPAMKRITAAVADIAAMPRQECVTLGESPEVKTCEFGDQSGTTSVVLFGDSHAIQWFNPLRRMAEAHGWKLTTIVKSGCPATDINPPRNTAGFVANCSKWRADAIRRIVSMRPSVVFIGNASGYLNRRDRSADETGVSADEWRAGTARTLQALSAARVRAALMRDTPRLLFDVPTCLARSVRHSWYSGGSCAMDEATVVDPAIFDAEKVAARDLQNVHLIDMIDQLCQKNICFAVQGGEIVYRDDSHLTGSFAERLKPVLEERLLAILNAPN